MPWEHGIWKENVVSKEDFQKIHRGLENLKIRVASWSALIKKIENCYQYLPKDTRHPNDCQNYAGTNKTLTEQRLADALNQANHTPLQGADLVADIQAVLDLAQNRPYRLMYGCK